MNTDIAMHASERGILVGANGTGKSTLANYVLNAFRDEYPNARIAVLDTKPRWRAEYLADGTRARRVYKHMAKGDTIPGSMQLTRASDWPIVWNPGTNPSRTVIVQRMDSSMIDNIKFQTGFAEAFFRTQKASVPSLLYLDEGMDFFSTNSAARGGSDIVQRCFRAGRERGLATLIGVQRPVGINLQCLTETSWCAVFRINYTSDIKRLYDMGWPMNTGPPEYEQTHCFRLWKSSNPRIAPLYKLGKAKAA